MLVRRRDRVVVVVCTIGGMAGGIQGREGGLVTVTTSNLGVYAAYIHTK